jgi:hypothetical protein
LPEVGTCAAAKPANKNIERMMKTDLCMSLLLLLC